MKTLLRRALPLAAFAACLAASAEAQAAPNPKIELILQYTCFEVPYYFPSDLNKPSDRQKVRIYTEKESLDIVVYENNVCATVYLDRDSSADAAKPYVENWGCQRVVRQQDAPEFNDRRSGNADVSESNDRNSGSVGLSESNYRRKIVIDPSGAATVHGERTNHDDADNTEHVVTADERIVCVKAE